MNDQYLSSRSSSLRGRLTPKMWLNALSMFHSSETIDTSRKAKPITPSVFTLALLVSCSMRLSSAAPALMPSCSVTQRSTDARSGASSPARSSTA